MPDLQFLEISEFSNDLGHFCEFLNSEEKAVCDQIGTQLDFHAKPNIKNMINSYNSFLENAKSFCMKHRIMSFYLTCEFHGYCKTFSREIA